MRATPLEQKIAEFTTPLAVEMGLELVQVRISGDERSKTVQIMAEDPATGNLLVDKAAELSRAVSAHMDVEDPINGNYRLEVSSPGIDRMLTRKKDFETYITHEAKLETMMPNENGQKRFRGFLQGIDENDVIAIKLDTGIEHVPFNDLAKAKLILTDELIEFSGKRNNVGN